MLCPASLGNELSRQQRTVRQGKLKESMCSTSSTCSGDQFGSRGARKDSTATLASWLTGYDPQTRTVYQLDGCSYHGCKDFNINANRNGLTTKVGGTCPAWVVRAMTARKGRICTNLGYKAEAMTQCRWKKAREDILKSDSIQRFKIPRIIENRAAMHGVRVESFRMFYGYADGERILDYDVTSLYPFVHTTTEYPVGEFEMFDDLDHPSLMNAILDE